MSLSNTQYDAIMRNYEETQTRHRHKLEERVRLAYAHHPRFREIEEEIAALSVSSVKERLMAGSETASQAKKEQLATLRLEKAALLKVLSLSEDYFDMTYDCPDCKDTGYIEKDGYRLEKCHCFRRAEAALLYRQSNLGPHFQKENFNTFSFAKYPQDDAQENFTGQSSFEAAQYAYDTCLRFCNGFSAKTTKNGNLLLLGRPGVGKTFLCNCIAGRLLEKGISVLYLSVHEFFQIFEARDFNKANLSPLAENWQAVFDADLLILDDLGAETTNAFTNSKLYECLNHRLLSEKSTIITSNLSNQELEERYSERIFSRLQAYYTRLRLYGPNQR